MCLSSNKSKKIIVESEPTLLFDTTPDSIANIISQMGTHHIDSPTFLKANAYMIWHLIFENLEKNKKIMSALEHIDINNKNYKELAAELNISVSTLTRRFKKYYNTTPASYSLNTKIDKAKVQLSNTDMTITQISNNLGFNSLEYFSRIFKKKVGISPLKYRNTPQEDKNIE